MFGADFNRRQEGLVFLGLIAWATLFREKSFCSFDLSKALLSHPSQCGWLSAKYLFLCLADIADTLDRSAVYLLHEEKDRSAQAARALFRRDSIC